MLLEETYTIEGFHNWNPTVLISNGYNKELILKSVFEQIPKDTKVIKTIFVNDKDYEFFPRRTELKLYMEPDTQGKPYYTLRMEFVADQ